MSILFSFVGFLILILLAFLSYLFLLPIGSLIPVNRKYRPSEKGVRIFISTNGMHTDFIVPTKSNLFDWTKIINGQAFAKSLDQYPYLGIGWGDPNFYLELEAWDKLSLKIAVKALLIPSKTIMHVIGYDELPYQQQRVKEIYLTNKQFIHLCSFIYNAFELNDHQEVQLIPAVGYTPDDNFYKAIGSYHAIHTCNYWVNKGLKKVGVRTALWSPLDKGIFYQLEKTKINFITSP